MTGDLFIEIILILFSTQLCQKSHVIYLIHIDLLPYTAYHTYRPAQTKEASSCWWTTDHGPQITLPQLCTEHWFKKLFSMDIYMQGQKHVEMKMRYDIILTCSFCLCWFLSIMQTDSHLVDGTFRALSAHVSSVGLSCGYGGEVSARNMTCALACIEKPSCDTFAVQNEVCYICVIGDVQSVLGLSAVTLHGVLHMGRIHEAGNLKHILCFDICIYTQVKILFHDITSKSRHTDL